MRQAAVALSITLLGVAVGRGAQAPPACEPCDRADALYALRENPVSAKRAADILEAAVRKGGAAGFDAAWRLARVWYWSGDHAEGRDRSRQFDAGAAAARLAIAARPNRPVGHFWLGLNLGGLAETGVIAGLRHSATVRAELEEVIRIDPGFEGGSAFAALGGWHLRVPGFLGGDKKKAEESLRRALTYDPNSTVAHYFLAETLIETNRLSEGRAELQRVIAAPFDPEYEPEDKEWKQKARVLLAKLK